MINLIIDNIKIEVREGTSLIEAAREHNIDIPSLCYKKGIPHYSSCMLCIVKDIRSNKFIPSCSAYAEEGMNIDAMGNEVTALRKEAVSLLLTEHRAECEAPCKVVCPAGLNIPEMNRHIMNGDITSARELVFHEMESPETYCTNCPGYCEKACRRKMIDKSISIRSLVKFIVATESEREKSSQINPGNDIKLLPAKRSKRFNSTIGKIEESEKTEWLKECMGNSRRYNDPASTDESVSEASNCMHCDCRALDNCSLREIADELNVKNPRRIRTGPPIEKKINSNNNLIFENAKCIKCGLCVRVSRDETNNPSLCFTGRGFMSLISQPVTHEFNSILGNGIDEVINVCPTGALAKKV